MRFRRCEQKPIDLTENSVLIPVSLIRPWGTFEAGFMDKDLKEAIKTLGHFSAIGLSMAIAISLGAFAGNYLDRKLGTYPWCTLVFLGLGISAAFRNLYLLYKRAKKC